MIKKILFGFGPSMAFAFFCFLSLPFPGSLLAQAPNTNEILRWEKQAKNVTIIRDNWGIPHIYGASDADAVFGLMYAQCEDDFSRVEMNYIEKLGRRSEVSGESEIYDDLLIQMLIDTSDAIKDYEGAPEWLKHLLNAYADGINYYLYKNPGVKPALLQRFEPWFPLLWTDGSIGAISTGGVSTSELERFYSGKDISIGAQTDFKEALTGSNGFAFSPSITKSGNAILYINPHVTFYFRPEVHVISEEGLNAYGAVTWGQFFVYQGFNEHCGWMHTSSDADISDSYIEQLVHKDSVWYYEYENELKPVLLKKFQIKYLSPEGLKSKEITGLYTHHGPIMAKRNGQYLSVRHNNRDMKGLIQSWLRTKANGFDSFKKTMELLANPSNNTVYADAEGNVAYWHGNFIPRRNPKYDWSKPVDGSLKDTEWQGLHSVEESVHLYNPSNGWLQNCNSTPFTVAGDQSPNPKNYMLYMAPDGENFRGINAVRVLSSSSKKYSLTEVIAAGYNKKLSAFEVLVPALVKAYDLHSAQSGSDFEKLKEPMGLLRSWDFESSESSIPTSLSVQWGESIRRQIFSYPGNDQVEKFHAFANEASPEFLLSSFKSAIESLDSTYGRWDIPWGEINRFQRLSADINSLFDDSQPSFPVGFASSTWGMLPSYNSRSFSGTTKRYGVSGNSFIAAVEFGPKIKALSLLAGGQSGDPSSPHFKDQLELYAKGQFKEVLFYKDDILKHAEKVYQPGTKE